MNRLLVDIGNSRIKWRLVGPDGGPEGVDSHPSGDIEIPPAWHELQPPSRVFLSAVAGDARLRAVSAAVADLWHCETVVAETQASGFGVENGYRDPAQLGVDRWLALIGARHLTREPVVVIDAGTVITVDLMDEAGRFHGGMLLPGLEMLRGVFASRVPHLARVDDRAGRFPANNTADGIALGIEYSTVAAIGQFIENSASVCNLLPDVLLTGGDAAWLERRLSRATRSCPNLVLDGLEIFSEHDC